MDDPACSTGCSCSTEGCCSDVGCCEFGQCLTSSLLYDIKEDYLCTRQQEYLFDIAFFAYDEDTRLFPAPYVRLCTCSSGGAGSSTKQWPYFTYNANTKLCKCYRKVIAAYHSTGSLSGVGEFGPVVWVTCCSCVIEFVCLQIFFHCFYLFESPHIQFSSQILLDFDVSLYHHFPCTWINCGLQFRSGRNSGSVTTHCPLPLDFIET